jgi:hypothetical protein
MSMYLSLVTLHVWVRSRAFMCLIYFIWHNVPQVHPRCYEWQLFLPFTGSIVFLCVCVCICTHTHIPLCHVSVMLESKLSFFMHSYLDGRLGCPCKQWTWTEGVFEIVVPFPLAIARGRAVGSHGRSIFNF